MSKPILNNVSDEDIDLAQKCMLRATSVYPYFDMLNDRTGLLLDIIATHKIFDLRLDELLEANDSDFFHDIGGIYRNFDRSELVMRNCFCPRFANNQ